MAVDRSKLHHVGTRKFEFYSLRGQTIGGQDVGFTPAERLMHIAGEDWTPEQWLALVDRVQKALEREGWVEKKPLKDYTVDPNSGTSSFLTRNVKKILRMNTGLIQPLPWYLKWLSPKYQAIITREELE
jgi:hypothetical protein